MKTLKALVGSAEADPGRAYEEGVADLMLRRIQTHGEDPAPVRRLLATNDNRLHEIGTYVLGELGSAAQPYLHDVLPLTRSGVPRTRYQALEIAAVCATGALAPFSAVVLDAMDDEHDAVRKFTWELCTNLSASQYRAAASRFVDATERNLTHLAGIHLVLSCDLDLPEAWIADTMVLRRGYGTVALRRSRDEARLRTLAERPELDAIVRTLLLRPAPHIRAPAE